MAINNNNTYTWNMWVDNGFSGTVPGAKVVPEQPTVSRQSESNSTAEQNVKPVRRSVTAFFSSTSDTLRKICHREIDPLQELTVRLDRLGAELDQQTLSNQNTMNGLSLTAPTTVVDLLGKQVEHSQSLLNDCKNLLRDSQKQFQGEAGKVSSFRHNFMSVKELTYELGKKAIAVKMQVQFLAPYLQRIELTAQQQQQQETPQPSHTPTFGRSGG